MFKDERRELRNEVVAGREQVGRRAGCRLNAEGAEADGVVLAEGVERLRGVLRAELHLRDEERVARALVLARPLDEVREVDVGREEVYLRRARAPHVQKVRQRAGARVLPRLITGADERRVDEQRDFIFRLA